jgi:hypothetical protein
VSRIEIGELSQMTHLSAVQRHLGERQYLALTSRSPRQRGGGGGRNRIASSRRRRGHTCTRTGRGWCRSIFLVWGQYCLIGESLLHNAQGNTMHSTRLMMTNNNSIAYAYMMHHICNVTTQEEATTREQQPTKTTKQGASRLMTCTKISQIQVVCASFV